MTITVDWHDDSKTLIRYDIAGRYTATEIYEAHYRGAELGRSQPHNVDVLIDMQRAYGFPPAVLRHMGKIAELQTPNTRCCVIVTNDSLIRSLFAVAVRVYPRILDYFYMAPDENAAMVLIEKARQAEQVAES